MFTSDSFSALVELHPGFEFLHATRRAERDVGGYGRISIAMGEGIVYLRGHAQRFEPERAGGRSHDGKKIRVTHGGMDEDQPIVFGDAGLILGQRLKGKQMGWHAVAHERVDHDQIKILLRVGEGGAAIC